MRAKGHQGKFRTKQGHKKTWINLISVHLTSSERECLEALFLTEPEDDRKKLINDKGERVPSTCEWITIHEKYLHWLRDPASRLLWISGGPGTGKTMLSIFLTEEISARVLQSRDTLLAYHFCDNNEANRRTGISILRALIYQILRQRPSFFRHILPDFEVQKKALFTSPCAQEALWRILRNALLDPGSSKTVILAVIDGLDECEQPSLDTFLKEYRTLFSSVGSQKSSATFKVILLSRDLPDCIPEELADHDRIRLDPDLEQEVIGDLRCFIHERVEKLTRRKRYPQDLRKLIEHKLLQRADGRFLWVAFVVRELESKSAAEVLDTLEKIPSGLHEVYDRLLLQIHESRRSIAFRILSWIVMAARPLRVAELAAATGCTSLGSLGPHEVIRDHIGYCGALVYITAEDHVGLIHQSVKDYLLRDQSGSDARLNIFWFNQERLHAEITDACLNYLHNGCLQDGWIEINPAFLERFPFYRYAMRHWGHHAAHSTHYDYSHPFFEDSSDIRAAWVRVCWPKYDCDEDDIGVYPRWRPDNALCTLLHVAAALGLDPLAHQLVTFDASARINQADFVGCTPLEYAAQRGHVGLVHLLLKNQAKTEGRNVPLAFQKSAFQGSALHVASKNGGEEIVKLLLEFNAKVNVWAVGSTPLILASRWGREGIVRLLLEAGADVNAISRRDMSTPYIFDAESPLMAASRYGRESIVRLLLEKGANTNVQNGSGEFALLVASEDGHESIVRLLLENGANTNMKDGNNQSALMRASRWGRESVVQLLLGNGAEINGQDVWGTSALMMASANGYESTVRLLLENGADINVQNIRNDSALTNASCAGHESIARLLLKNGADINMQNICGDSALMKASGEGHESTVRLLLENEADINIKNDDGQAALMKASGRGRESIVQLLLEHGAEIDAKDHENSSALMMAVDCKTHCLKSELPLGSNSAVVRLLLENGATINLENNYGDTALTLALMTENEEMVQLLLEKGADVNLQDNDGQSPLMMASVEGFGSMVRLLLENGADIDARDHDDDSALMLAIDWKSYHVWPEPILGSNTVVIRLLLEKGATTNCKNNEGHTALSLAMKHGYEDVIDLLREHGATE